MFAAGGRKGAEPKLIVGATEGKLIVGGTVGRPERGAAPVVTGALIRGVVWTVGVACRVGMVPGRWVGWVVEKAGGKDIAWVAMTPWGLTFGCNDSV